MSLKKKITKRRERELFYKATHKLLCPKCEGVPLPKLMIQNMGIIPFLVTSKCKKCGYEGILVEIPVNNKEEQK